MPPHYRVELNLPPEEELFVPRAGFASSTTPMQLAAPTWTASYSSATPPRRHLTAADAPSSPAGSTASQKFEVKRLLSRPADLAPSPRPLTTFDTSMSLAGPSSPPSSSGTTIKRSNSAGRGFLKRRSSRGHVDASAPASTPIHPLPRPRTATAPGFVSQSNPYAHFISPHQFDTRHAPHTPSPAASTSSLNSGSSTPTTLTPASAYALAYAQRTKMSAQATPSRSRHPFEGTGGGRIVALGDPSDESLSLSLPALALAGFGAGEKEGGASKEASGLSRKISARFRRRKAPDAVGMDVQSDVEVEEGRREWGREKERAGFRAVGLSPVASRPVVSEKPSVGKKVRNRMSRHLSIEDFRSLVRVEKDIVAVIEKERGQVTSRSDKGKQVMSDPLAEKKERTIGRREGSRPRYDSNQSLPRTDDSHYFSPRKDDPPRPASRKEDPRRETTVRSFSSPGHGYADLSNRTTGTISPENKSGGGKLWRLVKKMSTGTLKEKRSTLPEKVPPVPRLPSTLPSSRRSSVADYGEEIRPALAQFRSSSSRPNTIHQSNADLGGSTHSGPGSTHSGPSTFPVHHYHTHAHRSNGRPSLTGAYPIEYRPSMTNTNESSVLSSSPKSSFGRTQSPRTSMSSYVDVADDPPPLPLPATGLVGKHIVAPGELAQYNAAQHMPTPTFSHREPNVSPSLPPPKRPRKPRDKAVPVASSPPPAPEPVKTKSKPNVLRRPARLMTGTDEEGASGRLRSPRSASMGMPSPRSASISVHSPRARSHTQTQPPPSRPRSNSMSTVFTFREIGGGGGGEKKKLSEQEKVDKFERLLEASDKAGGTLHARLQEQLLLSETMRMSGTFGEGSSVSGV